MARRSILELAERFQRKIEKDLKFPFEFADVVRTNYLEDARMPERLSKTRLNTLQNRYDTQDLLNNYRTDLEASRFESIYNRNKNQFDLQIQPARNQAEQLRIDLELRRRGYDIANLDEEQKLKTLQRELGIARATSEAELLPLETEERKQKIIDSKEEREYQKSILDDVRTLSEIQRDEEILKTESSIEQIKNDRKFNSMLQMIPTELAGNKSKEYFKFLYEYNDSQYQSDDKIKSRIDLQFRERMKSQTEILNKLNELNFLIEFAEQSGKEIDPDKSRAFYNILMRDLDQELIEYALVKGIVNISDLPPQLLADIGAARDGGTNNDEVLSPSDGVTGETGNTPSETPPVVPETINDETQVVDNTENESFDDLDDDLIEDSSDLSQDDTIQLALNDEGDVDFEFYASKLDGRNGRILTADSRNPETLQRIEKALYAMVGILQGRDQLDLEMAEAIAQRIRFIKDKKEILENDTQ